MKIYKNHIHYFFSIPDKSGKGWALEFDKLHSLRQFCYSPSLKSLANIHFVTDFSNTSSLHGDNQKKQYAFASEIEVSEHKTFFASFLSRK